VRLVVVDLLEDVGYAVLVAEEGEAALEILGTTARIDLMVSDVGLPGSIDGRKLATIARDRRPGLKVLFITGYSEDSAVGSRLLADGGEVLTKPFSLGTLAKRVRSILER
jgi:CheY-like chemotaxis protein